MRKLFISYARENKADVEELVRDLDSLGCQTWMDSSLRGGQSWWEEILRQIADCDGFLAVVSSHTLNSVACKRELEWALALNKPVLPVAVERLPDALPRSLAVRQIVDYSQSGKRAALALAGGLAMLPPAPPPPNRLPEPPPPPLSYLSDLIEQVSGPDPLTHEQQRHILIRLEPALRAADLEERRGGRFVLNVMSRREDVYADVERTLTQWGLAEDDAQLQPTTGLPLAGDPQPTDRGRPAMGGGGKAAITVAAIAVLAGVIPIGAVILNNKSGDGASSSGSPDSHKTSVDNNAPAPPSSTTAPSSNLPAEPMPLTGKWSGSVSGDQTGFDVVADIRDGPPLTGSVVYPQLNCSATWTQHGSADNGVRLVSEEVTSGPCVPSEVALAPQDDGTLHFTSTYYSASQKRDLTVHAILRRTTNG